NRVQSKTIVQPLLINTFLS
ncbi:hypothetical protein VCHC50A2_1787B, partial [Vibrio cholerae HC-50A2]